MADLNKGKPKKGVFQRDANDATGVGGERRRRKIDDIVDDAVSAGDASLERKRRGQTTDSNNGY